LQIKRVDVYWELPKAEVEKAKAELEQVKNNTQRNDRAG